MKNIVLRITTGNRAKQIERSLRGHSHDMGMPMTRDGLPQSSSLLGMSDFLKPADAVKRGLWGREWFITTSLASNKFVFFLVHWVSEDDERSTVSTVK